MYEALNNRQTQVIARLVEPPTERPPTQVQTWMHAKYGLAPLELVSASF
jgi:hypothetical protein